MTTEEIELINKVIKNQVFDDTIDFIFDDTKSDISFKFNVKGTKKMISVGEYYDYLVVDVLLIDFDDRTKQLFKIIIRHFADSNDRYNFLLNWLKKEYRFNIGLKRVVSDVLTLFSDNKEHVRVHIDNIIISDYLKNSVDNIVIDTSNT